MLTIGLKGADDSAGTVAVITGSIKILNALPTKISDGEPIKLWGGVLVQNTVWRYRISVTTHPYTTLASANDHGDFQALQRIFFKKYLWITNSGTSISRTGMTAAGVDYVFWTDITNGFARAPIPVVVTAPPELTEATGTVSFTLETVDLFFE